MSDRLVFLHTESIAEILQEAAMGQSGGTEGEARSSVWSKVTKVLSNKVNIVLGTVVTVILSTTMRGDWIFLAVHFIKQYELLMETDRSPDDTPDNQTSLAEDDVQYEGVNRYLAAWRLQNAHWHVLTSMTVSYLTYHGLAGTLHWYYYVQRRHRAKEWKCQPDRFLTPDNERHEILLGSANMAIGAFFSGILTAYILNGGYTGLYFTAGEKGWTYLVLSTIFVFLIQDGVSFYIHKFLHTPWVYRNVHKHHHRYHSPTAWSATAMHPAEFISLQLALIFPIFFIPMYSGAFIMLVLYAYYYGMIDHSGVYMEAIWPWQPSSMFHDDHHKYFHTNFGFNTKLWDWLHDTIRTENRIYSEEIFGGRGKSPDKLQY